MFTEEEVKAAVNSALPGVVAEEWVSAGLIPDLLKIANALPAKREGDPIDAGDVRAGDIVAGTIARQCTEYTRGAVIEGVAHQWVLSGLCVAGWHLSALDDLRLLHRPAPELPTKAPAVIKATEVRGVKGEWWLTLDVDGGWNTHEKIDGYWGHYPEQVTEWKPADFVVRES